MGKEKEGKQKSYVFITDPDYGWRPAIQESVSGNKAIVSVPNYKDEASMTCDGGRAAKKGDQLEIDLRNYPHGILPLQNVDANGDLVEFPDMVRLPYLHEAAILYNLKKRHMDGKPYTRTGDIVIAVNPFQWFLDLYTEKKRIYYSNRLVWEASENDPRESMEPHIYEISSLCYKGLAFGDTDQSILVSGESGAGKTETVKICMNHMASVQQGPKKESGDDSNELDPVVARVVQSNPLLETFGNAKTRRNDNSSRFGKYLQLQFDKSTAGTVVDLSKSTCTLAGSKSDVYLLEKNRVCYHDTTERTYHVMYQLLAAPDSEKSKFWSGLKGKHWKDFRYVGHTDTTKIEKKTDEQHYQETVATLALVGVEGDKLDTLFKAVAIVIQCGNLTFGAFQGDKDKSEVTSKAELDGLAELMGVDANTVKLAFTERTMKTRTETYKVPLNQEFAKDACDAFAKDVYGKLFLWVVQQVNNATRAEDNYKGGTMKDFGTIGLLDIFGFESFTVNRFDQLCINYANEKLQQKFTEDVFRAVQLEYEAEGIELAEITYDDNSDVLDLIEGRGGLLAMLNEECVRPKGNDQDFVQKALQGNKKSPCLLVNKMDRMSFGIHHYAGKVMYDADGFVSSNQDTMPTDLEEMGTKSSNEIVNSPPAEEAKNEAGDTRKAPRRQKSNLVGSTIWGKYKTQLASLMANLRKTQSRYIRCVKPNMAKVPVVMEHIPTIEQLRCAGVVAAVTLARSAFPNRLDNSAVRFRYASMWEKSDYPSRKTDSMSKEEQLSCDADAILLCALKPKETVGKDGKVTKAYVVGKTKSYFRAGALEYLEANRASGLDSQAITIQRFARGMLVRKRFQDLVKGAAEREREERARKEREEQEAKEKAEREAAERQSRREREYQQYKDQIDDLKKKLKRLEQDKQSGLEEANERKAKLEEDIADLKEKTSKDNRKKLMEPKRLAQQQEKKLKEAAAEITKLKAEHKKNRKDHDKIKEKYDVVVENNDKLLDANETTGDEFESKEAALIRADEKNNNLVATLEKAKKDNKKLKEKTMKKQEAYMAQAESRLEYQKAMARILTLIQEKSSDPKIVNGTVDVALECEAEAKNVMSALADELGEEVPSVTG